MSRKIVLLPLLFFLSLSSAFAAPEQWTELHSAHFTLLTDAGGKEARHTLDQFERMRWVFQTLFPKANVDPASPIVVIALKNQKGFQALEPRDYLAKGQMSLAGLFLKTQDKNYILLRLDAQGEHPFATIYHEYTHLQFSAAEEWMPLWLNEGLAEFFQNTEIHNKDVALGEASADDLLYLQEHQIIPLAVLFQVDASSPYYHEEQKGSVFYAESWALTHYLIVTDRQNRTNQVSDYMRLMSQHADALTAAQKEFGDLKKLQDALESYIRQSSYNHFVLSSAAAPIDESAYTVKPLTQAEADAARADVMGSDGREDDARALLDAVLKADPKNVQAHETMGKLEFRDGNREAARKWYEEAVQLDSQSYLAHYYFAMMSMGMGADTERDAGIESSLRTAIKLNPGFAPACDALAMFFGTRHEKMDEAHMLNLQAVSLDPGNLGYRLNTATVLTIMDRYSNAVAVLQNALPLAKTPGEAAMVRNRIDQLERVEAMRQQVEKGQKESATSAGAADAGARPEYPAGTTVQTMTVNGQKIRVVVGADEQPKHPTEPPNGPKHTAEGVIRNVKCSYPTVIELQVQSAEKTLSLYNNDYYKITFSATGFTQKDDLHPCNDLEGMKTRVQYAESSDKTVDGQIVAIDLRK
jgi:tetratricopeptide (TPR) repeat protein